MKRIYIPLCFYLIIMRPSQTESGCIIYIPLCFYLIDLRRVVSDVWLHLHSIMLLLNRINSTISWKPDPIYIPLCFYLILWLALQMASIKIIYIPLCFYLIPFPSAMIPIAESNLHSIMLLLNRIERGGIVYPNY